MTKRKCIELKYINNYPVAINLLNKEQNGVLIWTRKNGLKDKQYEFIFETGLWREVGSDIFFAKSSTIHHKLCYRSKSYAIHRWFFYPKAVELEKAQQKEKEQREKDLAKAKRSTRGGLFIPIV